MPFKKGQSGNPEGKVPGTLNKATLLKEERRAVFEQEVTQVFIDTIHKARPEYLLDQYLGKAPDKLEVDAKVETSGGLSEEVIAEAKRILKERLTNAEPVAGAQGNPILPEREQDNK